MAKHYYSVSCYSMPFILFDKRHLESAWICWELTCDMVSECNTIILGVSSVVPLLFFQCLSWWVKVLIFLQIISLLFLLGHLFLMDLSHFFKWFIGPGIDLWVAVLNQDLSETSFIFWKGISITSTQCWHQILFMDHFLDTFI